jgi:uncharacterized membrane protein/thiol-disulfide isomerase/thioredoxin
MNKLLTLILLLPVWLSSLQPASLLSEKAIVHAVLFYSPNCGHCHLVITETLPPLFEKYGDQLSIVGVDVTQPAGQTLFMAVLQYFNLQSGGVPFLVIGDTYLVGSIDIPEKLPGLIEQYLAQGGVDWPAIPGLAEAMMTPQPNELVETPTPQTEPTSVPAGPYISITPTPTPFISPAITPASGLTLNGNQTGSTGAKFSRDPLGNTLSVIVLGVMILSIGSAILFFRRKSSPTQPQSWEWAIPILCLIGIGVAAYLAYVETAQVEAVCGPVGDCNTVQQSEYARLFGLLPIGVLGLIGYVMILLAWGVERSKDLRMAAYASLAILGMTTFGVLFSIYLTYLEPFVIGATCAWCLTSAVIMTASFWFSLAPAKVALSDLSNGKNLTQKRSRS